MGLIKEFYSLAKTHQIQNSKGGQVLQRSIFENNQLVTNYHTVYFAVM
jgi:hypothetical protein